MNRCLDGRARALTRLLQVKGHLHAEPELGLGSEVSSEPQRGIGRDRPLAMNEVTDAHLGHTQRLGERILAHAERSQEVLAQDLARMSRWEVGHDVTSLCDHLVVVDDLHIVRIPIAPDETDPPLVVDPDAVLTSASTREGLQAVAGRCPQVVQGAGVMEMQQLPVADPQDLLRDAPARAARPSGTRGLVPERPDADAWR